MAQVQDPGTMGGNYSYACDVSSDGNVVVGVSEGVIGYNAFR